MISSFFPFCLQASSTDAPLNPKHGTATQFRQNGRDAADSSAANPLRGEISSPNASASPSDGAADAPVSRGTVLFLSDDDYFRSTMRAFLEDEGFRVRSCADAARVPKLFFSGSDANPLREAQGGAYHSRPPGSFQGTCIDLLLMDVHTLGWTGVRLAAELAGFEPDLPVIVISVPETGKREWAAMARRGWKFLSKPVLLPSLLELIHCALGPANRARRLKRDPRASPAADDGPRSGTCRSVGTDTGESTEVGELPLRLLKAQGIVQ